jgi:hypothetical protein
VSTLWTAALAYKRAMDAQQSLRGLRIRGSWVFKVLNATRTDTEWRDVDAVFAPERPPNDPGHPDDPSHDPYQGLPTWEEVKWLYDQCGGAMAELGEAQPALYVAGRSGSIEDLVHSSDPIEAYNAINGPMLEALSSTFGNIGATRESVLSGDRDPLDFGPIVEAVRFGYVISDSRTEWPGPFYSWITGITVSDHSTSYSPAVMMGLGALAIILAFIPGADLLEGAALVALFAASAVKAKEAWDLTHDLEAAEGAAVRPGEDLVDPGAAAAAHATAVADTVFAFIAALGPAAKILGAAGGAADAAAAAGSGEAGTAARAAGEEAVGAAGTDVPAGAVPAPAPTAPIPEPVPGGTIPEPAGAGVSARPPAAGPTQGSPSSPPVTFDVDEVQQIFRRAIKREPTVSLANLERDVDEVTFAQAYKNAGGEGSLPAGFVDPKTNRIWIRIGQEDTLTVFHESVHQYSMVTGSRGPFLNQFGDFLEEGITESVTRDVLGPRWTTHGYDRAVEFINQMESRLGVPRSAVLQAYFDGDLTSLRTAIQAGLGGDIALSGTFMGAVRNIGASGTNTQALRDALYMMIVKRPPP